jgi:hypothetical protein
MSVARQRMHRPRLSPVLAALQGRGSLGRPLTSTDENRESAGT